MGEGNTPAVDIALNQLSKNQLEELSKRITAEKKRRYKRSRDPKYGDLNKGFMLPERDKFFAHLTHKKARTICTVMKCLGTRISEACKLRTEHVDLAQRRAWIRRGKGSRSSWMYLHDEVYEVLRDWMTENPHPIYVFPAEAPTNKYPYASPNWLRKKVRQARAAAGLDFVYGESEEPEGRHPHRLYRLTSHSLRHTFITQVYKTTGDLLIAQRLAGHVNIRNTERYVFTSQEEVDAALINTFAQHH